MSFKIFHLPINWKGAALFTGGRIKRSERKLDQTPPSNTQIKNAQNYTLTCLFMHRNILHLPFTKHHDMKAQGMLEVRLENALNVNFIRR